MVKPDIFILLLIMVGILFESELVIWAEKHVVRCDIVLKPIRDSVIRNQYWKGRVILIPLTLFTIFISSNLASLYPSVSLGIRLFSGVIVVILLPFYRFIFGFFTGNSIVTLDDKVIIANNQTTKVLLTHRIAFILILVVLAFILAFTSAFV